MGLRRLRQPRVSVRAGVVRLSPSRRRRRRRLRRPAGGFEASGMRPSRSRSSTAATSISSSRSRIRWRPEPFRPVRSPIPSARSSARSPTSASCWRRSPTSTSRLEAAPALRLRGAGAGERLSYDTLIVAGGSHYSYFGHEEWRTYAAEVKSLESALGGPQPPSLRSKPRSPRRTPRIATPGSPS